MESAHATEDPLRDDALTGLAGREAARARLAGWLMIGRPIHAMSIALRRLDTVNLAFGAVVGDAALANVAQRIRQFAQNEIEGNWLAARGSGGQFLLISAEPCSREQWEVAAGHLLDRLAQPIAIGRHTLRLSARAALIRSVGDEDADVMLDRLAAATSALMAAPARRMCWADGTAARLGRSAAQLEADLLRAIDRNEISVVFQPQWACADGRLIGAEALARWNHPRLGRVGAGTLFAVAERADHVAQLSRHIAQVSLHAAQSWPAGLRLSLNITPNDLLESGFARTFAELIETSKFNPDRLTLEITEQVLLGEIGAAAVTLASLRELGCRIALDDFGAGFCNFRYLKILPLDYLKLDRAMIPQTSDPRDLAVLRGIIAMAGALGLSVIAEGIETETQRDLITAEGCAAYQGFVRAQPMSGEEFLALAAI